MTQTHGLRWHLLGWDLWGARGTHANVLLTLLAVLRVTEPLASDPGVSWLLAAPRKPRQTSRLRLYVGRNLSFHHMHR